MDRHWTFGQKIIAGFAVIVAFAIAIGAVSTIALRAVVASKDQVIVEESPRLVLAERMHRLRETQSRINRQFLLTGDPQDLADLVDARKEFDATVEQLRQIRETGEGRQAVGQIEATEAAYRQAVESVLQMRRANADVASIVRALNALDPVRTAVDKAIDDFVAREARVVDEARQKATDTANTAVGLILAISIAAALIASIVAYYLARTLNRQISTAVGQVQSSSAELQAAANQQAAGIKEQATSMTEITTTITELLATARQIAESAQRVSQIAEQTATSAQSGDGTVGIAHDSIAAIRRQVDMIVNHMLALGKKSQEIGSVLDIVSELAEQTNILSINATIEAAGAGEAGKRFAVVADEIRKLADRVADSAKEIRALIDDVRSSVNTTVMATETGSKAVDAGSQQFGDVAASFKAIARLVATTTEAAREIELSTKQQSTAVEQVNIAISNVAQAAKESEASTGQTLQTASQLASLSKDLLRLVQARAAAA
jgi:methyl-accepting chemotaxis protein